MHDPSQTVFQQPTRKSRDVPNIAADTQQDNSDHAWLHIAWHRRPVHAEQVASPTTSESGHQSAADRNGSRRWTA